MEAETAQGRYQGEQGCGQGDVAEVLRGQLAGEDDDGDPVDEPARVGAAQGVDRSPRDPPERHLLPAVYRLRVFRPAVLVHSVPWCQSICSGGRSVGQRVEGAALWTPNRDSLPFCHVRNRARKHMVHCGGQKVLVRDWLSDICPLRIIIGHLGRVQRRERHFSVNLPWNSRTPWNCNRHGGLHSLYHSARIRHGRTYDPVDG